MNKKSQSVQGKKEQLYEEIANHCDGLCIARYIKNEAKNALKYFHTYKLLNIKKNLREFSDYLIFLNSKNCQEIETFKEGKETKRSLNNSISYFYNYDNISDSDLSLIKNKIETNTYETITLMQSIKGYLILTIDEFCNASPTRVDIMRYNIGKEKAKVKIK